MYPLSKYTGDSICTYVTPWHLRASIASDWVWSPFINEIPFWNPLFMEILSPALTAFFHLDCPYPRPINKTITQRRVDKFAKLFWQPGWQLSMLWWTKTSNLQQKRGVLILVWKEYVETITTVRENVLKIQRFFKCSKFLACWTWLHSILGKNLECFWPEFELVFW